MRSVAKMMLATGRAGASAYGEERNGQRGDVNYAYGGTYATEARRRRDSRGRFMSANYGTDDSDGYEVWNHHREPEYPMDSPRDTMRGNTSGYGATAKPLIGFGRTGGNYRADTDVPDMMEADRHPGDQPKRGHGNSKHKAIMDMGTAVKWVEGMRSEDGKRGAHWGIEQVKQLMKRKGIEDIPLPEFWAVMNMLYSDYGTVIKEHGMQEQADIYADMARAFIQDKDAVPNKVAEYYSCIVEGE